MTLEEVLRRFTFSRADLAEQDPTAFVLPWSNTSSAEASYGTIVHQFLSDVRTYGVQEAIERAPEEHRKAVKAIDLSSLPASDPDAYASEVSFAYNVDTGEAREIGRNLNRRYEGLLRPREIVGTLDVVGVTSDAVIYPDYKSGFADLGPVRENLQLRIGVLAASRAYGKARAFIAIIRLKPNGESYWDKAELSELDLDATEHAVRRIVARIERAHEMMERGEQPPTNEGEECRYCPAFPHCPAKMNLARAILRDGENILPEVLNEQTAPLVYARLKAVEEVMKRVWKTLEEYASVTPVQLENGWVYGAHKKPRTTINAETAPVVLQELGFSLTPEVKKTITNEALEDAIRLQLRPGMKLGATFDAVMEVLIARGGATRIQKTTVEKHRVAALKPPKKTPQSEENAPDATQN